MALRHGPTVTAMGRLLFKALVLWLVIALGLGASGAFVAGPGAAPWPLVGAVVVPVLVFAALWRRFADVRRTVLSLDPRTITLAHTLRLGAVAYLWLQAGGLLPAVFATPAAWGGFVFGASAPFIALVLLSARPVPKGTFALWHMAGIAELAIATALLILAGDSAWGVLAGAPPAGVETIAQTGAAMGAETAAATTAAMTVLPLSLVPTLLVPLFAILHLVAILQAAANGGRQGPRQGPPS